MEISIGCAFSTADGFVERDGRESFYDREREREGGTGLEEVGFGGFDGGADGEQRVGSWNVVSLRAWFLGMSGEYLTWCMNVIMRVTMMMIKKK